MKLNKIKNNSDNELDLKVINNIKTLGIDMINTAKSGHPGIVLGAAPILYRLYNKHLMINPTNPNYINRDRFVMSAGHGSALLYATLYMSGFDFSIDDLKEFRKFDSKTPGHPEITTPGVDASTGPLGQGLAMGVGMALGEQYLNKKFKYQKTSLINHYTYVLVGDGDLMEGISYEAAAIAGNYKLKKLIVLYDSNGISLDGDTKNTLNENVLDRFKALNWDTYLLNDPYNFTEFDDIITKAKSSSKPSIVEIKTIIGDGSKHKNTNEIHGKPLDKEDIKRIKRKLKMRDVEYTVLSEAYDYMKNSINERIKPDLIKWEKNKEKILSKLPKHLVNDFTNLLEKNLEINIKENSLKFNKDKSYSGRDISHTILNKISDKDILCLTTDTSSSTKVYLSDKDKNIKCGVREFAASAIMNGISLMNIKCITSSFLSFASYMIPSIRMAALMKLNTIYLFTHDTVLVGEDGPTHQPIEQLDQLRLIPNVTVFRPCDVNEMIGAYKYAFKNNGPVVIIASKETLKPLNNTSIIKTEQGGYVLKENIDDKLCIISSGSEVNLALKISKSLEKHMLNARVVSIPSLEIFAEIPKKEQEKILPNNLKKVVIELSTCNQYYKYLNTSDLVFNVTNYLKSGNKQDIITRLSYNEDEIIKEILKNIK